VRCVASSAANQRLYFVAVQLVSVLQPLLTGYACFKSHQALKTPDQLDDRQWLTYWVLTGMFEVLFCITNYTLFIVPFYDEAKLGLAAAVFLSNPSSWVLDFGVFAFLPFSLGPAGDCPCRH